MADRFDLIVKGGTVVNHDGTGARDIGVREGRIAALGSLAGSTARVVIDAAGLHVLPGVIDTQVHFREPGLEHKENLETGCGMARSPAAPTANRCASTRCEHQHRQ